MAAIARPHEKHASAESATSPSDHFMPSRMWNVTLSGERSHLSANPGPALASLSKLTSRS